MRQVDCTNSVLYRLASILTGIALIARQSEAFVSPSSRVTSIVGHIATNARRSVAVYNSHESFWGFLNNLSSSNNGYNDPGPPVTVTWNPWQAAEYVIWNTGDDTQEAGRQLAPMIVHWSGKEVAEFLTRLYLGEKQVSLKKIAYESMNVRTPQWFGLDNEYGVRQLTALLMKALPDGVLTPSEIVSSARLFLLKYHSWPADFRKYGINQHLEGDTFATRGHSADIAQVLGSVRKQRLGDFTAMDVVTMVTLPANERHDEEKKREILDLSDFFGNLGIKLTATDKVNVVHGMALGGWTPSDIAKLVGQIKLKSSTTSETPVEAPSPSDETPYFFAEPKVKSTHQQDEDSGVASTTVTEVEQILQTELTRRGTISIHQPRSTISLTSFLHGNKDDNTEKQNGAGPPPFSEVTNQIKQQNGVSNGNNVNDFSYFASFVPGTGFQAASDVSPPVGVPILYDWVQYLDGSLSGKIKNSPSFADGTFVSTSPVAAGAKGGDVVSTSSGSRYFLKKLDMTSSPNEPRTPERPLDVRQEETSAAETTTAPPTNPATPSITTMPLSQARATMSLTEFLTNHKHEISGENVDHANPPPFSLSLFLNDGLKDISRRRPEASGRPKPTGTNYNSGGGSTATATAATATATVTGLQVKPVVLPSITTAPPGVPTLYNWVQYIDGSVFGRIRGSQHFEDGAYITTSPIPAGAAGGRTVTTASGSRYFLERPRDEESQLTY